MKKGSIYNSLIQGEQTYSKKIYTGAFLYIFIDIDFELQICKYDVLLSVFFTSRTSNVYIVCDNTDKFTAVGLTSPNTYVSFNLLCLPQNTLKIHI